MKNKFYFFIIFILSITLVSCSNKKENNEKEIIYTSFFPVAELTRYIVEDKMEVKTIMSNNDDPHSFDIKAKDMIEINKAKLIIYNGAGMEIFIENLKETINNEDKFLDLSKDIRLLGNKKDDKIVNLNPHTWLSVKNAIIQLNSIYEKLKEIDKKNKKFYEKNLIKKTNELSKIDSDFQKELNEVEQKEKYFVTAHAAFNYLANDYGLKQVAVAGVSPDQEPSARTLVEISKFIKEKNINTIFFDGKATPKVAETLARETNAKISTLYTMEKLTEDEMKKGYIGLMEYNFNELIKSFKDINEK